MNNNSKTDLGYHELLPNFGYFIDIVPKKLLDELKEHVDLIQNNFSIGSKANASLAGEIQKEYFISPKLKNINYIHKLVNKFEQASNYISSQKNPSTISLSLNELWINYQIKHEYNPIHRHGGLLSFVIWYQIPYLIIEEKEQYSSKPNKSTSTHGDFHFVFPKNRYEVEAVPLHIDKQKEGIIAIFPANLHHVVHPFYSSDDYRITIAGNIIGK